MTEQNNAVVEYQPPINLQQQVPKEVLSQATTAAKALQDVIAKKPRKVIFNGEQYLEMEDWETLGRFYHLAVKTHDPDPVEVFGVQGFRAKATVIDTISGLQLGSAEAYCMRDEENWGTRKGKTVPMFQLASMAQTRAGAKALRNLLAWVAVLAGYRPTPAEEMDGVFNGSKPETPAQPAGQEPKCKKCGGPMRFVPAGIAKTGKNAGKEFSAFWICNVDKGSIKDSVWKEELQKARFAESEPEPAHDTEHNEEITVDNSDIPF